MVIPVATTTIEVSRVAVDGTADPYDVPVAAALVATGVRAHLSAPSGTELRAGGSQERIDVHLDCDPTDLAHTDTVVDLTTGLLYEVQWVQKRTGFGLDRMEAGLKHVRGLL